MRAFVLFLILVAAFAACRPAAAPVAISNKPVSVNEVPTTDAPGVPTKPVPEMTWAVMDMETTMQGEVKKIGDFKGKAVILDFWATFCPPCIEEIPHLKELQKKYGKDKLEIVGLHVGGEDDRPKVPAFVKKLAIDYPIAVPEDALTRFVFGSRDDIPQTLVLDRDGKVVKKLIGFGPGVKKDLDDAVEAATK